jgi:membrane associated rhomboid family serine protease
MLAPPSLRNAPYYPVTSSIAVASIAFTLIHWGKPMDEFIMNNLVWEKWQIWRALTATLLHGGWLHLAFNLYWFWTFGTLIERVFGHLQSVAIFVLLALCSMLAEYTFLLGGIGLSGVVYGFWGMLWVLEKKDDRFRDAVDEQTSSTFVIWFFLCIGLTISGWMPVANIAHGVGAITGGLLGFAICGRRQVQRESIAGLVVILCLGVLGSTVYWPKANFSAFAKEEIEDAGLQALQNNEIPRAVKLLERAAHMRNAPARMWFNLGIAYRDAGRYPDAVVAFERAAKMPDADEDMRAFGRDLEKTAPPAVTNR